MARAQPAAVKEKDDAEQRLAARLDAIEEQGRQTLELVRALVGLLLPKADKTGPSLEDLLSALLAQQGDMIVLLKAMQAEQQRQDKEMPGAVAAAVMDALRQLPPRAQA